MLPVELSSFVNTYQSYCQNKRLYFYDLQHTSTNMTIAYMKAHKGYMIKAVSSKTDRETARIWYVVTHHSELCWSICFPHTQIHFLRTRQNKFVVKWPLNCDYALHSFCVIHFSTTTGSHVFPNIYLQWSYGAAKVKYPQYIMANKCFQKICEFKMILSDLSIAN